MRLTALLLCLSALAACSDGSTDDSSAKEAKKAKPELTIASPEAGGVYTEGDTVHLKVTATVDGKSTPVNHADWSAGSWTRSGNDIDVSDLPVGNLTLQVEALVDGATATQQVDLTIEEKPKDTDTGGGGGGGDVAYSGSINAQIELHGDYDIGGDCPGGINLTGDSDSGDINGGGRCTLSTDFGDYDIDFTIEGTAKSNSCSGDLIMVQDGTEYRTPFTGTGNVGKTLTGNFDSTYQDGGNSLRIHGSWTADPS